METFRVEKNQQEHETDVEVGERSHWVLNSPDPPPPWKELLCSIRDTICPPHLRTNHSSSSSNSSSSSTSNKATAKRLRSFMEGLFPILHWGRNYKASKFKNDLMAGLTLASLSIPQVYTCITNFAMMGLITCFSDPFKTLSLANI